MEQVGENRVKVSDTKGSPPTNTLKVSATYFDGFRITVGVTIRGFEAEGKCRKTLEAVLKRTQRMMKEQGIPDFTETRIDLVGAESEYGSHSKAHNIRECWGRLSAKHSGQEALNMLLREMTSSGTSMSPGTTGGGGGRAKPSPVVRLFSFFVDKETIQPMVHFQGESWEVPFPKEEPLDTSAIKRHELASETPSGDSVEVPLIKIAHGRSGDKGNNANIGILARKPEYFPIIRDQITEDAVQDWFSHFLEGGVDRFDLPGVSGINFLLHDVLGGGGIASLRHDPQGKAYAQILLDYPVKVPAGMLED
jgi:hypothetical protein